LSLFKPSAYVKTEHKSEYVRVGRDPFTQADRERFLIGMMKVNFLKRLESSVRSFEITMARTIDKIESLERKIRNFQTMPDQNPENNELEFDLGDIDEDEDSEAAFQVGGKFKYKLEHIRLNDWLKDLQRDKEQLNLLLNNAEAVTAERDAKLKNLKELITAKVSEPTINKLGQPNKKVLVFTAFADTASYLFESLRPWVQKELGVNMALVTGSGDNKTTYGKIDFNQILINFSPRSKKRDKIASMPKDAEIDILIATDCISEGQNLQDCDYLVNYDIHWNPVRIIQRFGRIDRIGSASHTVQLVNFWPTKDLEKYVNLKNRVEARMALVDIAATFEDNILKTDELEELIHEDLRYRDKQLLRLREEVLDLEDFSESVALNEFTLDDFRMELAKYIESNRQVLENAPLGLYAVVPPSKEHQVIAPGVIYCLRQKGDAKASQTVNPLQPYYLVYVRQDGTVRFGFAQPKQILEIFRLLCAEKTISYEALCNCFDQETRNGSDMSVYSTLLHKATDAIVATFRRRVAAGLQTGRDFVIPDQNEQANDTTDFELITWLVIKDL